MTFDFSTSDILQAIAQALQGQRQSDGSYNVLCPAHDDKDPSCNVKDIGDKLLVKCYAGCSQDAVIAALKSRDLWPRKANETNGLPPGIMPLWRPEGANVPKYHTAHWEYRDKSGRLIGYTVRYDCKLNPGDKAIIPYFKKSGDNWKTGGPQTGPAKPLYGADRLQDIAMPVLIVEGEKSADAADKLVGEVYACITWMGGTGAVKKVDWTPLNGRDVFIWPDKDNPGTMAADVIKSKIPGARIISPPDNVPEKWDLADAVAEGWTRDRVVEHIRAAAGDPGQDAGSTAPRFKLMKLSDIEMKPADWLTQGFMEMNSLNMIFSDPGGGKSFFAIDQGCCVAAGKDFHGMFCRQGPVVFIAGEGQNGLKRRFMAWGIRHGVDMDRAPIFLSLMPAGMCDTDQVNFVIEAIQAVADEYGQPVMVVLDTVARNFGPGDENSTRDMSGFIAGVDKIRERFYAAVLLVHHTGHADKSRARGAMALKGALDTEYRLEKDEMGVIRVTCTKMKDNEPPHPMAFRLNTVELPFKDAQGNQATSAILDDTEYKPPPSKGKQGRGKWQTVSLEILGNLYKKQRENLKRGGYDPDDSSVLLEDWRQACLDKGMNRETWRRLREGLHTNPDVILTGPYVRLISDVT